MSKLVKCGKCNGEGKHMTTFTFEPFIVYKCICRRCGGTGKVDWLKNITKDEMDLSKERSYITIHNKNKERYWLRKAGIIIDNVHYTILTYENSCKILVSEEAKKLIDEGLIFLEETNNRNFETMEYWYS